MTVNRGVKALIIPDTELSIWVCAKAKRYEGIKVPNNPTLTTDKRYFLLTCLSRKKAKGRRHTKGSNNS